MKVIAIIVLLAAIAGAVVYILMKKGVIKDEDGNNIPDSIDDKIKDVEVVVEEVKKRVERVKEEGADVVGALKNVGAQVKDVAAATKGTPRKGRKPAQKKIVHSTPVEPQKDQKDLAIEKYKKAQK